MDKALSHVGVGLGERNRCLQIQSDNIKYDTPIKKVSKITRHLKLETAQDMAFLPDDNIVVCDRMRHSVKIFNESGHFIKTLTNASKPHGIATTASGMVAVVDGGKKKERVVKIYSSAYYNSGSRKNDGLFSRFGTDLDWKPRAVAFTNKGQLIVTDIKKKAHSVGMYTMDGRQMLSFGSQGSMVTNFLNPNYVTVDMFDRILVSDMDNHCIKVFDDRGKLLGVIGQVGTGPGQLIRPRGLCTDARGNIIVCNTGNRRVSVFSVDGRFIQNLLTSKDAIGYPYDVAYQKETRKLAVSQNTSSESGHLRKIRIYELNDVPPLKLIRG